MYMFMKTRRYSTFLVLAPTCDIDAVQDTRQVRTVHHLAAPLPVDFQGKGLAM